MERGTEEASGKEEEKDLIIEVQREKELISEEIEERGERWSLVEAGREDYQDREVERAEKVIQIEVTVEAEVESQEYKWDTIDTRGVGAAVVREEEDSIETLGKEAEVETEDMLVQEAEVETEDMLVQEAGVETEDMLVQEAGVKTEDMLVQEAGVETEDMLVQEAGVENRGTTTPGGEGIETTSSRQ